MPVFNDLIKGCRNLNRKAQREMVRHLSPFLFTIVRRYSSNREDANDLLQESLILIFNNINKCRSNEELPFRSWCRRIAINTALSKQRKKTFHYEMIDGMEYNPYSAPAINSQLNVEDILNLLRHLPEKQRVVFNLSVIDGYSHGEIAEMLGIKESSSRSFLTRARRSLKNLIIKIEVE